MKKTGLFETIRVKNSKIEYLADHVSRMKRSASALKISTTSLKTEKIKNAISSLLDDNNLKNDLARVKMLLSAEDNQRSWSYPSSQE